MERSPFSHRSASRPVLLSQEDRPPWPGSRLLVGSLHCCLFSSHSVPSVYVVTQPPCAVLGAGGDVEQSVNPPSAPWLFCAHVLELPGAWLARGCAVIAWLCLSCGAVCWQQLLALWGCCLALCSPGAEGRWGSSGVTRAATPLPEVLQLFIHRDEPVW